jgi:hypothetical protein
VTLDDTAEVTYMMWREEHIGNIGVLQRVHLSKLLSLVLACNWLYLLLLSKFINELNYVKLNINYHFVPLMVSKKQKIKSFETVIGLFVPLA